MALWIIAIVLVVVFFPILFGVAATAVMVIVPLGMLAYGIFSIVYFASAAVANPKLGQRVALGIMVFYIFLQLPPVTRWMYVHGNGFVYSFLPIVIAYAACLLMLAKNRGTGGTKGVAGMGLLLTGAVFQSIVQLMYTYGYLPLLIRAPFYLFTIAGYVLLLKVPAHSDTSAEEKNAVLLTAGGFLLKEVHGVLELLFIQGAYIRPSILSMLMEQLTQLGKYGSLLLLIAGTVLYAKFMLDRALDRAKSKKS